MDEHKRQRQQPAQDLELRILPAREMATRAAAASAEHLSPVAEQQFTQQLTYTDANIPLTDGWILNRNWEVDSTPTSVLRRRNQSPSTRKCFCKLRFIRHLLDLCGCRQSLRPDVRLQAYMEAKQLQAQG
eukprot:COSAG02_NODE_239_length_27693_cov_31.385700_10_plen_130_part_00